MDFTVELLKYGVVGLVAALFFYMYQQEKKDHQKTRDALEASYQTRIADSQKNSDSTSALAASTIAAVKMLSTKIESGKENA